MLGFATSTFAQDVPRVEVSGGWQLLYGEDVYEPLNGWFGDVAVNLNRAVALVAGVDRLYETFEESGQVGSSIVTLRAETRWQTLLGGARLNLRTFARVVPFAEVLAGAGRVSTTSGASFDGVLIEPETESSDTHSLLQIGGGLTLALSEALGVRVSVAHRRVFVDGESGSANRVAAGVTLRF